MLTPVVRRTYAPRGQTPIQPCWDRRDRITAISAISISPQRKRLGLYFRLLADNCNAQGRDTVAFLRQLKRHIPGPLTIIWDRGNIHDRSREVQKYLSRHPEIVTEKFPAYAPELNPDEQVWSHTKYGRMANFAAPNTTALRLRLHKEIRRLRKRTNVLASFVRHAELQLLL
jgi:transposase